MEEISRKNKTVKNVLSEFISTHFALCCLLSMSAAGSFNSFVTLKNGKPTARKIGGKIRGWI